MGKKTFFSLDLVISFEKKVLHKLFHDPFVYPAFKIVNDRSGGGGVVFNIGLSWAHRCRHTMGRGVACGKCF